MSNPFAGWTPNQVFAHNARVAKQSVKEVGKTVLPTRNEVGHLRRVQASDKSEQFAVITGGAISEKNTRTFTIEVEPCPAPRMTKRDAYRVTDKYPRRPCVRRYFDFKDTIQREVGDIPIVPDELRVVFYFPLPESWSKSKRQEMQGAPHRQRPDADNCLKAVQDALFLEDGGVWRGAFEKRWAVHGRVVIEMRWL